MSFRPGDRVRAIRRQSGGDGTVRRVEPGTPIRTANGETLPTEATVYVEWDEIPGATTPAMRTHPVAAGALERVVAAGR